VMKRMIDREINSPMTSSLGRLFDAVAAVVLNRRVVDYEAQAAIELERENGEHHSQLTESHLTKSQFTGLAGAWWIKPLMVAK